MDMKMYLEMLSTHGTSRRQRIINKSRHDTLLKAPDSPAFKHVEIDGVPHDMMIISTTQTTQKTIRTLPGDDFSIGGILFWSGSHWLITERDSDDEITVRGRIEVCQRQVIWQNQDTHEIISRWATADKPYFSNLAENKIISYSTREFKLQMPFDEETSKLNVGKRLMLEIINGEPKTYRITCIDQMTERIDRNDELVGFLVINVEQDLYNPSTDNPELMVCNYIAEGFGEVTPNDTPGETVEPSDAVTIMYASNPVVRIGGVGKLFKSYVNAEQAECDWTLSCDTPGIVPERIAFADGTASCKASNCKILCDEDGDLIGTTVLLSASHNDGVTTNLEVKVVSA